MVGDPGQDIGEPGARMDVVEPGRDDERIHGRGALATAIRPREQPGFAAEGDAAQGPLSGVRLARHRIAAYAAIAAVESWSRLTATGGLNPWRSMSQVAL